MSSTATTPPLHPRDRRDDDRAAVRVAGVDRALGYGLKYDDHFQHTHLGQIGHSKNEATS